ncbi:MAG: leucine-rich repeat domain-containing protein, partial [Bacteroidota bacterium]|nr:leucine-rich repeat domain-containing protein [Bacteroidota bacterium]
PGNTYFSVEDGILFNADKTLLIFCPTYELGSYTIPSSVTSIGAEAFDGCRGLTSLSIPNSVTSIGDGAFFGCNGLSSVYVYNRNPRNISLGGSTIFHGIKKLATLYVPAGSGYIRTWAGRSWTIKNIPKGIGRHQTIPHAVPVRKVVNHQ